MPLMLRPIGNRRRPKLEIDPGRDNAEPNIGENRPNETSSAPAQKEVFVHPLDRPAPEQLSALQKSLPSTDNISPP